MKTLGGFNMKMSHGIYSLSIGLVALVIVVSAAGFAPVSATTTPTTWKALFLIYKNTDVTYTWQGKTQHVVGSMTASSMSATKTMLIRMPSAISSWSGRNAAMTQTFVYPSRTLTTLTPLGGNGYWVSPTDVKAEIDKYAPTGRYDSVFVIWRNDNGKGITVPFNTGLSVGPSTWSNGAGYSQVDDPDNNAAWGGYYPYELFIHEWTHQTTDFYFHKGYSMPNIDNMTSYGYAADPKTGSWQKALSAIMQGKVLDNSTGKYVGITAAAWKRGTPIKSN
jgi:hypothetical protein